MIAFTCPGCAKPFSVKDDFAGRKTKCPKCGQPLIVPNAPVSAIVASSKQADLPETPAKLVLFRQRSATASMYEVTATVDGQVVGQLNEDETVTVPVSPGEHTVAVSGGSLRRSQVIAVGSAEVLEFETHFSNWGILGGGLLLQPMNGAARQAANGAGPSKTSYDMPGVILQIVIFAGAILAWGVGGLIIWSELGKEAGIIWNLLWLAAPLAFYWYRQLTMCPKCRRAWAKTYVGRRLIDRTGGYQTVTRYDEHKDSRGEVIGKTERKEQVHVVNESYLDFYQCKYCAHEWTGTRSHQYEG